MRMTRTPQSILHDIRQSARGDFIRDLWRRETRAPASRRSYVRAIRRLHRKYPYRVAMVAHALHTHPELRVKPTGARLWAWAKEEGGRTRGKPAWDPQEWKKNPERWWDAAAWRQCPKLGCTNPRPGHAGRCTPLRVGDHIQVFCFHSDAPPSAYPARVTGVAHAWRKDPASGQRQRRVARANLAYTNGETEEDVDLGQTEWVWVRGRDTKCRGE